MKRFLIISGALALLTTSLQAQRPDFGRGGGRGGNNSSPALQAQSRVVAVADERSNSIIISAPEEMHEMIAKLISEIDANVDDVTEVRVFTLKNADPVELSEIMSQLFSDTSQTDTRSTGFRPSFFFGGASRGGGSNNDRGLRSSQTVVAVADQRTSSLIVSAPRQMMSQVAAMVEQLDNNKARKQNVYVYTLKHADVSNVNDTLRTMFESQNNTRNNNIQNQNNQQSTLSNRQGGFGSAGATIGGAGGGLGGN